MRYFPIDSPTDERKIRIYYDSDSDKIDLLQSVILDYWEDYCNEHWIWHGKFEPNRWNYEDKTKRFLNRCANFLLMGEYQKSNILSGKVISKIIANEYSIEGDWQNENIEIELEETINYLNQYVKQQDILGGEMLRNKNANMPQKPRKSIKSKFAKMMNLYSTDDRVVDTYKEFRISHNFSVWDKVEKTIKGRKGLIDPSKRYTSNWCIVDTESIFKFNNNRYKIDASVSQYNKMPKKIDKRVKNPNYNDFKNDYKMDKILVYKQDDNIYFFDQNIDRIDNEFIMEL